jgi:hypothetical protein
VLLVLLALQVPKVLQVRQDLEELLAQLVRLALLVLPAQLAQLVPQVQMEQQDLKEPLAQLVLQVPLV